MVPHHAKRNCYEDFLPATQALFLRKPVINKKFLIVSVKDRTGQSPASDSNFCLKNLTVRPKAEHLGVLVIH